MFKMNHKIAFGNLGGLTQEIISLATAPTRAAHPVAKDILLGDEPKTFSAKTAFHIKDNNRNLLKCQIIGNVFPAFCGNDFTNTMFTQKRNHTITRSIRIGRDGDLVFFATLFGNEVPQRFVKVGIGPCAHITKITPCTRANVVNPAFGIFGLVIRGKFKDNPVRQHTVKFGLIQIQPFGWYRFIDVVARKPATLDVQARLIVVIDHLKTVFKDFAVLVIKANDSTGQIGENRIKPIMKQRQPMFHAAIFQAVTDRFIQRISLRNRAKQFAIIAAKP